MDCDYRQFRIQACRFHHPLENFPNRPGQNNTACCFGRVNFGANPEFKFPISIFYLCATPPDTIFISIIWAVTTSKPFSTEKAEGLRNPFFSCPGLLYIAAVSVFKKNTSEFYGKHQFPFRGLLAGGGTRHCPLQKIISPLFQQELQGNCI